MLRVAVPSVKLLSGLGGSLLVMRVFVSKASVRIEHPKYTTPDLDVVGVGT